MGRCLGFGSGAAPQNKAKGRPKKEKTGKTPARLLTDQIRQTMPQNPVASFLGDGKRRPYVTWIVIGMTTNAMPIAAMNAVLLVINVYGVWQYLLSPKNRKVMDRLEPVAARIEREVEAEERSA